ncbi:MAG: arylesterase [Chromatiaceae bacterium]|nr:MAG: arylesterase [Chromatiaceae bacterium]
MIALLPGVLSGPSAASAATRVPDDAPAGIGTPVLLVLGDSLSAAYGLPLDQGWVSLLQERLDRLESPWKVVNAGISGDTTAGGINRLPALLTAHRPALVMIQLGANDGLRGFAPAQIATSLKQLIALARDADAEVLLIGLRLPPNYGPAYTERFQRMFAEVAERTGVALVPRLLAGIAERPDLMQPDGLHPEAAAQPLILDNIWPVLAPMLGLATDPD